jgi:hypothetical protein
MFRGVEYTSDRERDKPPNGLGISGGAPIESGTGVELIPAFKKAPISCAKRSAATPG